MEYIIVYMHIEYFVSGSPHQLEGNAQMPAKVRIVQHMYYVMRSIAVLFAQLVQNVELHDGLVEEALLISDYLDGHMCVGLVIECPDHLAKAALANHLQNLIAKGYMIVLNLAKEL